MPYAFFDKHFPDIARRETRTATILRDSFAGLPVGDYGFLEMFCDEPGCDCRRVFFYVVSAERKDVEAVVAYGWEAADFYKRWLHDDDPDMIRDLQGPALNLGSPQSPRAPAILELVRDVLLQDDAYVERVKRHYMMFRERIDAKQPGKARKKKQARRGGVVVRSGAHARMHRYDAIAPVLRLPPLLATDVNDIPPDVDVVPRPRRQLAAPYSLLDPTHRDERDSSYGACA